MTVGPYFPPNKDASPTQLEHDGSSGSGEYQTGIQNAFSLDLLLVLLL